MNLAAKQVVKQVRRSIASVAGPAGTAINTVWKQRRRIVYGSIALGVVAAGSIVAIVSSMMSGEPPPHCVASGVGPVDIGEPPPTPDGSPPSPINVPQGPYPVTAPELPVRPYISPPGPVFGPNLIGPTLLTAEDAKQWWAQVRGGVQPPKLTVSIYEMIDIIWQEAPIEGVTPDVLFAQHILETGGYTNNGTKYNNFAGIAHYDNRTAEQAAGFATARLGVRAHVQLLKKVAVGNDLTFFNPPASPKIRWLGKWRTNHWISIGDAGWATAPNYGLLVMKVYNQIVKFSYGYTPVEIPDYESGTPLEPCPDNQPVIVAGNYHWALPLPRNHLNGALLQKPHHDYSAIDIAAPTGMPITAITEGQVDRVTNTGINFYNDCPGGACEKCGIGATIQRDDGLRVTYCHMSERGVDLGDTVMAGQSLGEVGNTGNSTGPHLHLGMTVNGVKVCPQPWLIATFNNTALPTSYQATGCSY